MELNRKIWQARWVAKKERRGERSGNSGIGVTKFPTLTDGRRWFSIASQHESLQRFLVRCLEKDRCLDVRLRTPNRLVRCVGIVQLQEDSCRIHPAFLHPSRSSHAGNMSKSESLVQAVRNYAAHHERLWQSCFAKSEAVGKSALWTKTTGGNSRTGALSSLLLNLHSISNMFLIFRVYSWRWTCDRRGWACWYGEGHVHVRCCIFILLLWHRARLRLPGCRYVHRREMNYLDDFLLAYSVASRSSLDVVKSFYQGMLRAEKLSHYPAVLAATNFETDSAREVVLSSPFLRSVIPKAFPSNQFWAFIWLRCCL